MTQQEEERLWQIYRLCLHPRSHVEMRLEFGRLIDWYRHNSSLYPMLEMQQPDLLTGPFEVLEVYRFLQLREDLYRALDRHSSRYLRNHAHEYRKVVSVFGPGAAYTIKQLTEDLHDIITQLATVRMEAGEAEYERVVKVAYSSAYKTTADILAYLKEYNNALEDAGPGEELALEVVGHCKYGKVLLCDSHEKMRRNYGRGFWCFARYGSEPDWHFYTDGADYCYVVEGKERFIILPDGRVFDEGNSPRPKIDGRAIMANLEVPTQ